MDHEWHFSSPKNESGFYLSDLKGHTRLSWPPELPKHDPRGNSSVPAFEPWKKAQDSKVGLPGNYFSLKGGKQMVPCHSNLEYAHLICFEMNPFVVEIRNQYPEWNRAKYLELKEIGARMPKKSLITIDFVLTLKIPGRTGFHYHGISTKPYSLLSQKSVKQRHEREEKMLAEWGCTHEIMTEYTFTENEVINNQRLAQYMLHTANIEEHEGEAEALAEVLQQSTEKQSYDFKMENMAEIFGWTRDKAYKILAIANFLGIISIDHEDEIFPEAPFRLRHYRGG